MIKIQQFAGKQAGVLGVGERDLGFFQIVLLGQEIRVGEGACVALFFSNDEGLLVGLHETHAEPAFTADIFPNPAKGQFTLRTDYDKGAVSVMMLNMQGQMVMFFTVEGQRTIDVSRLPAGVYTLQMLGGSLVTRKLVVE